MNTVVETTEYRKCVSKHLPSEERDAIIDYLAEHPKAGSIMQGTGGVRKLRWSVPGKKTLLKGFTNELVKANGL